VQTVARHRGADCDCDGLVGAQRGVGRRWKLCYLDGSYLLFAKTKAKREATHDGHPR